MAYAALYVAVLRERADDRTVWDPDWDIMNVQLEVAVGLVCVKFWRNILKWG